MITISLDPNAVSAIHRMSERIAARLRERIAEQSRALASTSEGFAECCAAYRATALMDKPLRFYDVPPKARK